MGFLRKALNGWLLQSDYETSKQFVSRGVYIINVAREINNPYAKLHLQYDDLTPIDIHDFYLVAEVVRQNIENGIRTLIHCNQGVHRSVTFSLATIYLIRKNYQDELKDKIGEVKNVSIRQAMRELCCPSIDFIQFLHEIPFHFVSLQDLE